MEINQDFMETASDTPSYKRPRTYEIHDRNEALFTDSYSFIEAVQREASVHRWLRATFLMPVAVCGAVAWLNIIVFVILWQTKAWC